MSDGKRRMNAQEAIEFTKYELEEHIFLLKHYEPQLPEDDEELIRFKNRGEALSIVLESAKLLHFLINEFEHAPGYRNFEIIDSDIYEHAADIYVDDEDTLIVRSDVVGKIGIEKGADE